MDRVAAVVFPLAFAGIALGQIASAQELARLHVRDFTLGADRTAVRVGEPFHLTIAARLAERLDAIDNVTLPNLSAFEELGDERRCSASADGTLCVETLTLDATAPGDRTIGAATLTAIDARTGVPSRFLTGTLLIHVAPSGAVNASGVRATLYALAARVLRFALIALFVCIAAAALWWGFRRRPAAAASQPVAAPIPPGTEEPVEPAFHALVETLAREPTREHVVAVRRALRKRANAGEHETLADLIRRRALPDGQQSVALAAVERAAFCEDPSLPQAIHEALPYLR